jgi:hypothetical protein
MELMGEYPSNIRSIEIERADSDAPVWKLVTKGDFFQVHSVPLVAGDNPVDVKFFWGEGRPVVPAAGDRFRLEPGIAYRLSICPSSMLGLCRSTRFVLQAN